MINFTTTSAGYFIRAKDDILVFMNQYDIPSDVKQQVLMISNPEYSDGTFYVIGDSLEAACIHAIYYATFNSNTCSYIASDRLMDSTRAMTSVFDKYFKDSIDGFISYHRKKDITFNNGSKILLTVNKSDYRGRTINNLYLMTTPTEDMQNSLLPVMFASRGNVLYRIDYDKDILIENKLDRLEL